MIIMRIFARFLIICLLALAVFISCSSTEGGGSGGVEPLLTAPEIVEGFMCAGIFEDKPVGIDNDFWVGDPVYIWMTWVNVTGTHEVKILWIEPGEKLYETKQTYKSQDGKLTTYFWLDTTSSATAKTARSTSTINRHSKARPATR